MRTLACPKCTTPMQTFHVVARDKGPHVELDRCPACRALWFDVKELERAAGRPYLARLRGNPSKLTCPACSGPMIDTLVGGEIALDECDSCKGALVDSEGVRPLTGEAMTEVKPPAAPKPQPVAKAPPAPKVAKKPNPKDFFAKVISYNCERCGKSVKMGDGGNVNGAMVCRECELKPWPPPKRSLRIEDDDFGDVVTTLLNDLFD